MRLVVKGHDMLFVPSYSLFDIEWTYFEFRSETVPLEAKLCLASRGEIVPFSARRNGAYAVQGEIVPV